MKIFLEQQLERTNYWLSFAETKNGVLVAFNIAIIAVVAQIDKIPLEMQAVICILFSLSTLICFFSFFSNLRNKINNKEGENIDEFNLLFYNDIAKIKDTDMYLNALKGRYNLKIKENEKKLYEDFITEIIINSEIAVYKYNMFNKSMFIDAFSIDKITLHDGDLSDSSSLIRIISMVQPDEIYNLAAQSHVQVSFDVPEYSGDVDALGVLRILEACRILGLEKKTKVYQASTSELYGKVEEVPQRETTPFHPYSPYAVAKQYGFWITKEYREAYGMFAVNGILFNHESERRGENFVTRKITLAAGRIAEGLQDHLELGNMDSLRDWGYAKDYVECMWMILQHDTPEDFVIATGEQHTVRDFTEKAFAANGITIRWEGEGINEKGYDAETGKMLVCVNPQWFRPTDVDNLWGDPTKAKTVLGWNPQKTSYEELVEIMAKHDRALAKKEAAMKNA